jgi:surface polysaccharide O-acyltransferase-like enzyme
MNRTAWLDHLRSFITLLVLAHHAALAYTTFAYFDTNVYINSTHPVVDAGRAYSLDLLVSINDSFFMPLMFFISGLVSFPSIQKKGKSRFLKDRWLRLMIPFMVAELIFIPLAYIPAYLTNSTNPGVLSFIRDYLFTQSWPVGPPWFLWLLFSFNLLVLAFPLRMLRRLYTWLKDRAQKPVLLFLLLVVLVAICYIPLSLQIGQYSWTGIAVFDFQLNRVFLYFLFFFAGLIFGSSQEQGFSLLEQLITKKSWQFWLIPTLVVQGLTIWMNLELWPLVTQGEISLQSANWFFCVLFVFNCVVSSIFFMVLFKKVFLKPVRIWSQVSVVAFGLYVLHYPFITWTQYLLLPYTIDPIIKFTLVFLIGLAGSWLLTLLLKKTPVVGRYI